ncbi:NAD(P)H-dependent flavin oxidoreductase, partial [Streptosporangium sp. NPDC001682]
MTSYSGPVPDPPGPVTGTSAPRKEPPGLVTRLTEMVGCRHPVVQTGMGYVAGARLAAATSAAGGLGVIAAATMPVEQMTAAIRSVKERTDAPFGVNIRSDADDAGERIDVMIREGVRVASFALAPKRELIARLKDAGVLTIPSVGARRHAEKVPLIPSAALAVAATCSSAVM